MSLYDAVADLQTTVEAWSLNRHRRDTSSGFERVTTEFVAEGSDQVGRGEDVTYDTEDHERLDGAALDLPTGEFTVDEFSTALESVELFPAAEPERPVSRPYRRWGVESAVLDLALRQHGQSLASAFDRSYEPLSFVVSTRLGEPPTTDRLEELLAIQPDLGFKLDPTADWDRALAERIEQLASVRILDLKGQYVGTSVDGTVDPDLYETVFETFPDAVVEDPATTDATEQIVADHADRVSWDAPIHGVADVDDRPFEPRWINVKPSRFGTVESLLETIETCQDRGISLYGGGQFELGPGREAIQALAATFYPYASNDVAPGAYNDPTVADDLPASPLAAPDDAVGLSFR